MKLHTVLPPASDAKFFGDEPTWSTPPPEKDYIREMLRGLNWHGYCAKDDDIRKYFQQWAKAHRPEYLGVMETVDAPSLNRTLAATARMHLQGFPLKTHHVELIVAEFARRMVKKKRAKKPTKAVVKKPSIQDRVKKQITATLAVVDQVIDTAFDTLEVRSEIILGATVGKGLKGPQLKAVITHLHKQVSEWELAASGNDPDLAAGYAYVGKRNLRKIIKEFRAIVDTLTTTHTIARKPRKKAVIDPKKVTKALNFVKSIRVNDVPRACVDPTELVKATTAWLYDTKTRKIVCITGPKRGLSVKGKSITGFKTIETKILRFPNDQLTDFFRVHGPALHAWFASVKTKNTPGTPSLTNNMILLVVE